MKAIEYKGQKVITTAMLAQAYGTSTQNIQKNFSRNKNKFVECKHYFYLTGEELNELKKVWTNSPELNLNMVTKLYLWTERGANHHCKILDTDKAWEQFENLEETYFRVKENLYAFAVPSPDTVKYLNGVANYLRIQRSIMKDVGCSPYEVAQMDKLTCDTYGIPVPDSLTAPRTYEQLVLNGYPNNLIEANTSK